MTQSDTSQRMIRWALEIGKFDIKNQPRSVVNIQVLANFVVEYSWKANDFGTRSEQRTQELNIGGSSYREGNGLGLILTGLEVYKFKYALQFGFKASNNKAKYKGLIQGLELVLEVKVNNLLVYIDSQLVVKQVNSHYKAKESNITKYLAKVNQLISKFKSFKIRYVPRAQNV